MLILALFSPTSTVYQFPFRAVVYCLLKDVNFSSVRALSLLPASPVWFSPKQCPLGPGPGQDSPGKGPKSYDGCGIRSDEEDKEIDQNKSE